MRFPARLRPALCLALLLVVWGSPASADLWRWIDAEGVIRYTPNADRVPDESRNSMTRVESGMAAAPARPATPTAAPVEPTPLYAPADEFSASADPFNAPDRAQTLRGDDVPEPLEPSATLPLGAEPAARRAPQAVALPSATPSAIPEPIPAISNAPGLSDAQAERRAKLIEGIDRDETALKELISSGRTPASEPSDELRAIADRLPQLQEELRVLEGGAKSGSDSREP